MQDETVMQIETQKQRNTVTTKKTRKQTAMERLITGRKDRQKDMHTNKGRKRET